MGYHQGKTKKSSDFYFWAVMFLLIGGSMTAVYFVTRAFYG